MSEAHSSTEIEPRRTRWWVVFGLWSIPALIDLNQRYIELSSTGEPFSWRLFVLTGFWYSWALLTPPILALTRRLPIRPPNRTRHLLAHAGIGSGIAVLYVAALALFESPHEGPNAMPEVGYAGRLVRGLTSGYPTLMMVYGVLVTIGMGLELRRRYRQGELRRARLESRLAEAQLAALRLQLQPHFLFNTLHAVNALMEDDVPAARRMIARLSELLRVTLASNRQPEVPLEQEIEVLERYLDIERVRLGDRLSVEYAIEDAALRALVPTLLLQPLVENAVRHGIASKTRPGRIRVSGRIDGETLRLSVEDDGPGLGSSSAHTDTADAPEIASTTGIGLANTRARLEQRYGKAGRLDLVNGDGRGLEVRIALPLTHGAGIETALE